MFREGTDKGKKVFKMMENTPIPALINSLGVAIVEAQMNMDLTVAKTIEALADREKNGIELPGTFEKKSLLELGFIPSFYHFSEVNISIRVALSSMEGEEMGVSAGVNVGIPLPVPLPVMVGVSLNASYSNKYSFTAEASSELTTKLVSLPPPDQLNQLIQNYIDNPDRF